MENVLLWPVFSLHCEAFKLAPGLVARTGHRKQSVGIVLEARARRASKAACPPCELPANTRSTPINQSFSRLLVVVPVVTTRVEVHGSVAVDRPLSVEEQFLLEPVAALGSAQDVADTVIAT